MPYGSQWNMAAGGQDSASGPTVIATCPHVGDKDPAGRVITDIYWGTKKFVIYQADKTVRYILPDDYKTAEELRRNIFGLIDVRSNIERLRSNPNVQQAECERAAVELAAGLAQAFESGSEADASITGLPAEVLKRTESRLRSLVTSAYRKNYIVGAIYAFIAVVVVLCLIMAFLPRLDDIGQIGISDVATYAGYCVFGGLGAFLSVLLGIRSIDFDIDLGAWEHFFAGLTRISIGVFAGIVVGLAIHSQFLNPDFTAEGSPQPPVFYFLAFIAGFSESLVPNLLRRGESTVVPGDSQGNDAAGQTSAGAASHR
jgi:hypothetical protein